jgi:hypothetical protein
VEAHRLNASSQNATAVHGHASELGLCLEISRGQTEHPQRPMTRLHDKFLIGGDDDCDLQLGGSDIPALHSLLQFDGGEYWIEAIAPDPQLFVNRQPVSSCVLRNGDQIEIGTFQLVVRLDRQQQLDHQQPATVAHRTIEPQPSMPHLSLSDDFDPEKVADLSAEELVDALDHEMQMIERFDRRLKLGAGALIDAVQQHRDRADQHMAAERSPVVAAQDLSAQNLDRVVEQLNNTFLLFDQRSQDIERREAACLEAAALLLEVQERMVGQLAEIEQKLAELRDQSERRHRASA